MGNQNNEKLKKYNETLNNLIKSIEEHENKEKEIINNLTKAIEEHEIKEKKYINDKENLERINEKYLQKIQNYKLN